MISKKNYIVFVFMFICFSIHGEVVFKTDIVEEMKGNGTKVIHHIITNQKELYRKLDLKDLTRKCMKKNSYNLRFDEHVTIILYANKSRKKESVLGILDKPKNTPVSSIEPKIVSPNIVGFSFELEEDAPLPEIKLDPIDEWLNTLAFSSDVAKTIFTTIRPNEKFVDYYETIQEHSRCLECFAGIVAEICIYCDGHGKHKCLKCEGKGTINVTIKCLSCKGRGKLEIETRKTILSTTETAILSRDSKGVDYISCVTCFGKKLMKKTVPCYKCKPKYYDMLAGKGWKSRSYWDCKSPGYILCKTCCPTSSLLEQEPPLFFLSKNQYYNIIELLAHKKMLVGYTSKKADTLSEHRVKKGSIWPGRSFCKKCKGTGRVRERKKKLDPFLIEKHSLLQNEYKTNPEQASFELAENFEKGANGMLRSRFRAIRYYELAKAKNNQNARAALAKIYAEGLYLIPASTGFSKTFLKQEQE